MIVERNWMIGRRENHRTGDQIFRRRAGKVFSFRSSLGYGDVSGSFHEFSELRIRHVSLIHEETVDIDAMNGSRILGGFHADFIHVGWIVGAH